MADIYRQPVAFLDWDNTLHKGYSLLEWYELLCSNGVVNSALVAALKADISAYQAGTIEADVLGRGTQDWYARELSDQPVSTIRHLAEVFVAQDRSNLYEFAAPIIQAANSLHISTVVISGTAQEVLEAYVPLLNLTKVHGLTLATNGAYYKPGIVSNPGTGGGKQRLLAAEYSDSTTAFAMGDSPIDWPLFAGASLGVIVGAAEIQVPPSMRLIRITSDDGQAGANLVVDAVRSLFGSVDGEVSQ